MIAIAAANAASRRRQGHEIDRVRQSDGALVNDSLDQLPDKMLPCPRGANDPFSHTGRNALITVSDLTLSFSNRILFKDVSLKFTPGNCYGLIGANGSGKTSFLKILSGELEPDKGGVVLGAGKRLSVLSQDHFAFESQRVLDTVIMGSSRPARGRQGEGSPVCEERFHGSGRHARKRAGSGVCRAGRLGS